MRLVLVGSGGFGVPAFARLCDSPYDVVAVVTGPVRRAGRPRSGHQPSGPVRQLAELHNKAIFDPEDINTPQSHDRLAQFRCDLLVVCDYGQILSASTLATARLGGVNLHASLLPRYRGAAPIPWAIYHGEAETGVSVIHMTPQVDAGPVIAQARTAIEPEETAGQLEARLAQLGAPLLCEAIERLAAGSASPIAQDPSLASKAPRLKKTHGLIDWNRSPAAIKNHVRAMDPWPRTYTYWHRDQMNPLRLIVGRVSIADTPSTAVCGTIVVAESGKLAVACKDGLILIDSLQPEGKRMMSAEEFLRGYPIQVGDRLGPETLSCDK